MPLTDEQKKLVIAGVAKYLAKLNAMKENYKTATTYAIASYKYTPFSDIRKQHYANALRTYAPTNYVTKMTEDKVRKWVFKYALTMFGVELTKDEIDEIIAEARSLLTGAGATTTGGGRPY